MHPEFAEAFEWDEGNESELAAHHVATEEAEDVFANGPAWARNRSGRSGDWKMMGFTNSGRRLTVVVQWRPDRRLLRPITAWDSTAAERTRYFDT